MKLFSYLDCPEQSIIARKSYLYLSRNNLLDKGNWYTLPNFGILDAVPELRAFYKSYGLTAKWIAVLQYQTTRAMHIDIENEPRFIIPIKNTSGPRTHFYECKNLVATRTVGEGGSPYYTLTYDERIDLGYYELTRPVVFNPKIPHQLRMDQELAEPRIALTIDFENPPYQLLEAGVGV